MTDAKEVIAAFFELSDAELGKALRALKLDKLLEEMHAEDRAGCQCVICSAHRNAE